MPDDNIPMKLLEAREQIDAIDQQLVALLADRFDLTREVGLIKANSGLEALDAERETRKLETIDRLCQQKKLNSELVTGIFRQIMAEVVENHHRLREANSR